ncbi:uracil-DNA glycosylase, putative [Ichthyophthirius multifiliis]|uniref:Uracil-DNA glycosylase, putative n=1 Tax=Ichthyophthirius multifiliis TaxID=5932 RepID=G0R6I3_ICHMU|nr:uracil-DNA glycosylase, putative [Ichthyophthirius multifiliis]EGR26920.1 uracil-DNA glycosylase, putative [Ichthyophthirius multifiliis]|eukprot:XP_004023804.1 uracil-DNA glycosylase, putative [Ichthyophthirius multifiliis]
MGLCFSVKKGVKPPPSLMNMYKSLENDKKLKFKKPQHGDLTKWANQVEYNKPESHKNSGWTDFTTEVIKIINTECSDIIFLLWGMPAQKKASFVDKNKHNVLLTSHPSPLSASRGFLEAQHFSKCNEILQNLVIFKK